MESQIIAEVAEQMKVLPQEMQQRVLEFTRSLTISAPHGVSGRQLLRFAGILPPDEARSMSEAIEQGCEQVDANEW